MSSYLENRKQYVCVNNVKSDLLNVKCGVLQGSILGPKKFILYINDICNISPVLNFILFPDDTNLFCTGNNIHIVCKTVTCELDKLNCWFPINKLSLNLSKTNFMIFTKQNVPKNIEVSIHNHKVQKVFLTKFLGVFIDCNLNWKDQILHVKKKVLKSICIMYKVSWKLNEKALLILYQTLIEPYLQYCCEIWGVANKTSISQVVVIQKRAVRLTGKMKKITSTTYLFRKFKILKFTDLVDYKIALVMYKVKHGSLPSNIQAFFQINCGKIYFTRQIDKFNVKYAENNP